MTKRELINLCLEWSETIEAYPFDLITEDPKAWAAIQHKDNKKAFAFVSVHKGQLIINLKCNPFEAGTFRQMFKDCTPGFHMNKEHWNTIYIGGDVPHEMLKALIEKSYDLTKPKQKRKRIK